MNNYLKEIDKKLKEHLKIEMLEIVDNSHKHLKHKSFSPDRLHLHLKIKSVYLKSITRISAHKMIMKILKNDLKYKIHALEITIEP